MLQRGGRDGGQLADGAAPYQEHPNSVGAPSREVQTPHQGGRRDQDPPPLPHLRLPARAQGRDRRQHPQLHRAHRHRGRCAMGMRERDRGTPETDAAINDILNWEPAEPAPPQPPQPQRLPERPETLRGRDPIQAGAARASGIFTAVEDTRRGHQDVAERARDRSTRDDGRTSLVPGTTRVEPPRRHGSNLVQQVLRLATQMDKENTKTAGTSTSEPKKGVAGDGSAILPESTCSK